MGKAEVNPIATTESSSSSDSEIEVINASMCDAETDGMSGGDENKSSEATGGGKQASDADAWRRPGMGPHGMPLLPPPYVMAMMHGGPHSRGPPPPPHVLAMMYGAGPASRWAGCPPHHGARHGHQRRGSHKMYRKWMMKQMMNDPEFWRKMQEKSPSKKTENLEEDFSKMSVDSGTQNEKDALTTASESEDSDGATIKCHGGKKGGKRCEQRRRWHEFMQHLREEMMAGNYGNWTQSSEDESEAVKPKAAEAEKSGATKKVQFEEAASQGANVAEDNYPPMMWGPPGMFVYPGFHRGHGPWARGMMGPRHHMKMWKQMNGKAPWQSESEASEEEDTHSSQEMRQRMREMRKARRQMCRQMGWMPFRRAAWGDSTDTEMSDVEEKKGMNGRCKEMCEKRQKFRALVKEIGARPWMFKVLAQELHGEPKPEKKKDESKMSPEKKERRELKQKFRKAVNEMGPEPWMFRVLGRMGARGQGFGSESEEEGGSPLRKQMRRNRHQMFNRMAREMGWDGMSDFECQPNSEDEEKGPKKCKQFGEKRQKFRALVNKIGARPWMFKLLARELRGESKPEMKKIDESKMSPEKKERREMKQQFRKGLNEIGARPWMFRVLGHMTARAQRFGSDTEGEDGSPCRKHMRRNRHQMFHRMAREMGWDGMSDSEDQGKLEKEKKGMKKCRQFGEKRQKFRALVKEIGAKPWMFKLLAQELHGESQPEFKKTNESKMSPEKKETREMKQKFRKGLREIGAEPWMFRVLARIGATGNKSSSDTGEEFESPCRRHRRNRHQMSRQMGWFPMHRAYDSEGQSEGQEKSEDDKEPEPQMATPWVMAAMMGPRGHHPGPWAHFHRHGPHGHRHGPHGRHAHRHGHKHGAHGHRHAKNNHGPADMY